MSKNQINVGFNASENVKPPKNCVCINGLNVSTNKTQENIKLTNNQAEYFSELAEEYKNMAAEFMEQAKYYAENNADVTVAQFEALEDSLENYALKSELPTKVSELQNDSLYVKESEMEEALGELELLPSRDGCENMYLKTDGADVFWDKVSSGLEVGDVAFTQGAIDETKGLRRVLNGSVVTRNSNTQGLFDWFTASVAQNPDMATTESEWQSENTANGMCGKFVYTAGTDSEAATLRLPNYPKYFIGNIAATAPVVGNGLALGLTDGTLLGGASPNSADGGYGLAAYGSLYGKTLGTTGHSSRIENYKAIGVPTAEQLGDNLANSGLETNIPAPYKIAGTYFIQIATGQETEVNITNEIELNNPYTLFDSKYAEAPLYNASWLLSNGTYYSKSVYPTAYEALVVEQNSAIEAGDSATLPSGGSYVKRGLSVKLSTDEDITDYDFVINTTDETFRLPLLDGSENLPGDKYDNISFPANGSIYTAPANGWLNLGRYSTANNQYLQLNATGVDLTEKNMLFVDNNAPNSMIAASDLFLLRGQQVLVYYNAAGDIAASRFVYAKGNGSLYFYVGETVQNANLINAGRIAEQISNCYQRTDSDNSLLAGLGIPDVNNYVDLSLAASQEEYTAPFNGWLHLAKTATAANQYIAVFVYNKDSGETVYKDNAHSTNSGYTPAIFIPIEKGAKFMIQYTTAGSTQYFRMIHLIGEGG